MTIDEAFALIDTSAISQYQHITRWADLGCGDGIFTHALARMLSKASIIYGIDRVRSIKPGVTPGGVGIVSKKSDFIRDDLAIENLDGILMANSLHYVKDKPLFIQKMKTYLKPGGIFLLVEYDTDTPVANWVPYPVSFLTTTKLFGSAGYRVKKLRERPSLYGRANMYSALVEK